MSALIAACAIALVLGPDFAYSRVVHHRAETWEQLQVRDAYGVRTDCAAYEAGTGRVAVLLIHGFGSSPAVFHRWVPLLAERGLTGRAMRLPGFGEPIERAAAVTLDDWNRSIDAEIEALASRHDEVWLIGHSMGGALAANAAVRHPDIVSGLVLVAPLCEVGRRRTLGLPAEPLFGLRRLLAFTEVLETCFPVDAHDPSIRSIEARDRFVPRAVYEAMFAAMHAGRESAAQLQVPVLVLAASEDRVVDFDAARRFAASVPGSAGLFQSVSPARHVVPLDTGWEQTGHAIVSFIEREGAQP